MMNKFKNLSLPIIVIGAGAAGFSAALELADRGYAVELIEKEKLSSGSSGRNPGRMGHGFHYVDCDTAKMYLQASIQVQRKYPDFLIGQMLPFEHHLRRGRYFITVNSDYPKELVLDTYTQIKEEYVRLIAEDCRNEVFGPPDNFFRILDPHEYENQVNMEIVEVGVETAEHLFDWQSFARMMKQKINSHPNIKLHENIEVIEIKRGKLNEPRYKLHTKKTGEDRIEDIFQTDYLVNSTWQHIEHLNHQIGISMVPNSRTNRLKALLVIDLPESLRNSNSMFFCMGQHCMMSNLGNGRAMITFAQMTNMEVSVGLTLSNDAERFLNGGATQSEKDSIAHQMLEGVSFYIPEIIKANIIDVKFGIVQTKGKLTLDDLKKPNNPVDKRNYYGVREEEVGLISNPCIKLFYFVKNGELVADILENHIKATAIFDRHVSSIEQ